MAENTVAANLAFDQAGFDRLLTLRDQEPAWVTEMRKEAWEKFQAMAWPTRRDEEWMRTDIRLFNLAKYFLNPSLEASAALLPESKLGLGVDVAGRLASIDGQSVISQLASDLNDKGVVFAPLSEAYSRIPEIIKSHLFHSAFDCTVDRFAALHQAMHSGGSVLYVPRGVSIEQPLHIQNMLQEGSSDMSHLLVILESGASATLLFEKSGFAENGDGLHIGGMEIVVGDGANFNFVSLQDWGSRTWNFSHQKAIVGQDANLQWTVGALGARLAKVNQHVELAGQGASCQVNGTMFTQEKQHLSYHTLQHHSAPNTRSDFLYKSALQDQSQTVWRGMIKVDKVAQRTDGYQRNDNLLLSSSSRADSIPGLEIEADDVRCTHGSTSGRVDNEQVFYCLSRGFTQQEAIRLIVTGFFQQIFDRIELESVREALGHAIARRVRKYD